MKMKQEKTSSDLEDGEIREEGIEDISDCSLSEIVTMKKDLESDEEIDIDVLREEALKSMLKGEEENNEEELEEELCRLEALKSLLKNIEANENLSSIKEIEKKRRPKRKRKQESKRTQKKPRETRVSDPSQPAVTEKVDQVSENAKKELVAPSRPWYPTAELALTCTIPPDESDVPSQKTNIEVKSDLVRQIVHVRTPDQRKVTYTKLNSPVKNRLVKNNVDKSSLIRSNPFKKVTKHSIRKFDSTSLIDSIKPFALQNVAKRGKYKLVNNANCATNKFSSLKINRFRNQPASRSLFSLNRLKNPQITVASEELIINLDDKDSDQEDDIPESSDAKTPLACDIEAKRDKVPADTEQPNRNKSKAPVIKDCSSNPVVRDDRSETTNSSSLIDVEVECGPHVHSMRSSTPPSDATLVANPKDESVFEDDKTVIISVYWKKSKIGQTTKNLSNSLFSSFLDPTCSSKSDEVLGELVNTKARDMSVLVEAEGCLVKIREKLLSDLGELDKTLKRNTVEEEKLNALVKKLNFLKSMVTKFETKIKLQESRLSANVACMSCLFNGVQTRTLTCSKFEEVCRTMGKNLFGPVYKPPTKLESVIADKRRNIDLSKCQSAKGSK